MVWNEEWTALARCKQSSPDELFVRGAEQHKAKHSAATKWIHNLLERPGADDALTRRFLEGFLKVWLVQHIQSDDRAFGDWL